jgi:hypothetical protein
VLEQVLGLGIDIELAALRVLGEVESRDLGNVLILALALLLLQLERDAADGATLNALHQVGGVAGNLLLTPVSFSLLLPKYANLGKGKRTLLRSLLEAMMAISSHTRLLVSKSRVNLG